MITLTNLAIEQCFRSFRSRDVRENAKVNFVRLSVCRPQQSCGRRLRFTAQICGSGAQANRLMLRQNNASGGVEGHQRSTGFATRRVGSPTPQRLS